MGIFDSLFKRGNIDGSSLSDIDANQIKSAGDKAMSMAEAVTVAQMLYQTDRSARSRHEIYRAYSNMMASPIISTAIRLHVTNALGGHENTGDVIFIEKKSGISKSEEDIVDDLNASLMSLLNRNAYSVCFNALGYGDAFSRVYSRDKDGIVGIDSGDFYRAPLVMAFEQGGKTVGFQISSNEAKSVVLTSDKMARMAMPRMSFVPQVRMYYNHFVHNALEDDVSQLKPIPSMIGGSLCESAEDSFIMLQNALIGLNSGRILDSVRESLITVNMENMTKQQQDEFVRNISAMLMRTKEKVITAMKKREPISENIRHIIPVWGEKQVVSVDGGSSMSNSTGNSYNTDDVMFYAKQLSGALGVDLSMLGFADMLSGGLGDGGFFRVSAQAGLVSRLIRQAFTDYCNHIIDIHCLKKYGGTLEKERPYEIVFAGASTSLEREIQETRERKTNASIAVLQAIQTLKEQGASKEVAVHFMKEQMGLDEDDAEVYAAMINSSVAEEQDNEDDI